MSQVVCLLQVHTTPLRRPCGPFGSNSVTEFDVALDSPDTVEQQAAIYARILEICLAHPHCKAMQSWGFTDRYSWRSAHKPLLLTDDYEAKPAYQAWQNTLQDYFP